MSQSTLPGPDSDLEEAFLADRQRFWLSWTRSVLAAAVSIVVLLILLTVFLV